MSNDETHGEQGPPEESRLEASDVSAGTRQSTGYQPPNLDDVEDDLDNDARLPIDLDSLVDIPVSLSLEIGRAQVTIRNLLKLNQGSVVELDRLAGEPMDVLVNGVLIAHGEVVVVNEKFGVRLTDVISPQERVRKLQ